MYTPSTIAIEAGIYVDKQEVNACISSPGDCCLGYKPKALGRAAT